MWSSPRIAELGPIRIWYSSRRLRTYRTLTLTYASKSGGPILKEMPGAWKHINGIIINSRWGHVILTFRRGY